MNCRIDDATAADLPAVLALERAVFSDPWSADAFRACLDEIFIVARSESGICGYLGARAVPPEGEILTIGVAETARREGIGGNLMHTALESLAHRGVEEVYLEVRESNAHAITFYANRGFEVVGRRPRYYRSPLEDAIVMMRQIPPEVSVQ